ncbi:collagen alpha-4(VI) chain-like, partial [Astyanax mexicanus]
GSILIKKKLMNVAVITLLSQLFPEFMADSHENQISVNDFLLLNVCFSAHCLLDRDMGTVCTSYEPRWFYDRRTGKCTHFWYGGCDGNSNRFLTEAECFETCGGLGKLALKAIVLTDVCQLPHDLGKCYNFALKWHFDTSIQECTRFWYGGCGGNGNRFETQEECEARQKKKARRTAAVALSQNPRLCQVVVIILWKAEACLSIVFSQR